MKIAAACEGKELFGHFGHCTNFMIFDAENETITAESSVPNPGHKPGFLPNYLADMGVNVIIAGSMGGGAMDIFRERGIEVITGAEGDARMAAEAYLKGKLKSSGAVCREHEHGQGHEHPEDCGGRCGR